MIIIITILILHNFKSQFIACLTSITKRTIFLSLYLVCHVSIKSFMMPVFFILKYQQKVPLGLRLSTIPKIV